MCLPVLLLLVLVIPVLLVASAVLALVDAGPLGVVAVVLLLVLVGAGVVLGGHLALLGWQSLGVRQPGLLAEALRRTAATLGRVRRRR